MDSMKNDKHTYTPDELVFIAERKRYRTLGIIMILTGLLSMLLFVRDVQAGNVSTFVLDAPGLVEMHYP